MHCGRRVSLWDIETNVCMCVYVCMCVCVCVCVCVSGLQQLAPPSEPSLQQVPSPICQLGPVSPPCHPISFSNCPSWPVSHYAVFSTDPVSPPPAHTHYFYQMTSCVNIYQGVTKGPKPHTSRSLDWASASAACFSASWVVAAFSRARFGSTSLWIRPYTWRETIHNHGYITAFYFLIHTVNYK